MAEKKKQTITVEMDPREAFGRVQREARERGMSTGQIALERAGQVFRVFDDAARIAAEGATLGLSDELAAAAGAITGQGSYEDLQARESLKTAQSKARMGPAGTVLEVGATIPTAGAGYALGTHLLRQTSPLLRYTVPGGVEGAIAGAGYADPGQRGQGATVGGLTGATVGGVLPLVKPVAGAVSDAVTGLSRRVVDPTGVRTAVKRVQEAAQRDEITKDMARARMDRMGKDATLMDIGGPNLTGLGATIGRTAGGGQKRVQTTLSQRQAKQSRELNKALRDNLEVTNADYHKELNDIVERRARMADKLYTSARNDMVILQDRKIPMFKGDRLRWLVDNSADLSRAIRRAQKLPQYRGYPPYSWDMVDRGYKYLNDQIRKLKKAGRDAQARDLQILRDDLKQEILAENPSYKAALDMYAGDSAMKDALELGRTFAKGDEEITRAALDAMSDVEKELFRVGVAREALKMTQGGATSWETNAVRRLFKNPEQVKALEPVFPNRASFLKFVREVIPLERQYRTFKRANPNIGSVTQPALSDEASSQLTDASQQWIRGNREGAVEMGIKWARDKIAPDTDEIRKATATILMPKTPQELQRSLDIIAGVKKPSIRRRLAAQVMQNAQQTFGMVEASAPAISAIAAQEGFSD